nr:ATP-binding protein [uncultured Desulfobacter sp.]
MIEKIQSSSSLLLGVINDILDVSKLDAGKLDLESIPFNLGEVLNNVSDMISVSARQKGLEVILDIASNSPHMVVGDPLRVSQILTNLANNAVKFTDKGQLRIGCRVLGSEAERVELELFVRDSGIGLSYEHQKNLFKAFSLADSSTTRKYGGTGLGLYITKTLVEMMDGRIWVDSKPGQGATFYFTIWLKTSHTVSVQRAEADIQTCQGRVLLVENNRLCRRSTRRILEALSFQVTCVDNARACIDSLESEHHDLIKGKGKGSGKGQERVKSAPDACGHEFGLIGIVIRGTPLFRINKATKCRSAGRSEGCRWYMDSRKRGDGCGKPLLAHFG